MLIVSPSTTLSGTEPDGLKLVSMPLPSALGRATHRLQRHRYD